jgi:uncharacterized membrane protein SpoIIM required for sporulation
MYKLRKYNISLMYLLSTLLYTFSIAFVLILSLILNVSFGEMNYTNDLGGWYPIFLHNLKIDIIIILGGFLLSVPAIILVLFNGFLFGGIMGQSIINGETLTFIKTVAPHGIIETAGFLLASCISLQISLRILFYVQMKWDIKFLFRITIQIFVCIILCLISALIEGR